MSSPIVDARSLDLKDVFRFCYAHPVQTALIAEHVLAMEKTPALAEYLLCAVDEEITGVCWIGGNITPVGFASNQVRYLAREIRRRGRRYTSIVGPSDQAMGLWNELGAALGRPREIRAVQPSLEIHTVPDVEADSRVNPTTTADFDLLLPAAVSMFTEEVGYTPLSAGGGYERRVYSLITSRRSLSRIDTTTRGREVIFKAELGTVGFGVTQIQGVWVNPRYRGQGIAAPAVAAVVNYARQNIASTVSLYVNDFNRAALATYARVGFERTGTFATILF